MTEQQLIKKLFRELIKKKAHFFPLFGKLNVTTNKGVYILYDDKGKVSHVGNTPRGKGGLCQRLNNHINKQSSCTKNFLNQKKLSVRNKFSFKFIEISSPRIRMLLQALTCGTLCPEFLGTHESIIAKK